MGFGSRIVTEPNPPLHTNVVCKTAPENLTFNSSALLVFTILSSWSKTTALTIQHFPPNPAAASLVDINYFFRRRSPVSAQCPSLDSLPIYNPTEGVLGPNKGTWKRFGGWASAFEDACQDLCHSVLEFGSQFQCCISPSRAIDIMPQAHPAPSCRERESIRGLTRSPSSSPPASFSDDSWICSPT
ncbi:hypothetical protein CPB85DRAFT_842209 [Mucidula mucida]|nr:hypothetical protein CPB85DRAFT_842209 [Mucidula mucida]